MSPKRPLTLQRLTMTTTTMADYMLVFMLQNILSLLGLLGQNCMVQCHCESVHMLHLFLSVFGEFQAPPYDLKCVESLTMDPCGRKYSWNDDKEEKKIVLVRVDMASVWTQLMSGEPWEEWTYQRHTRMVAQGMCWPAGRGSHRHLQHPAEPGWGTIMPKECRNYTSA